MRVPYFAATGLITTALAASALAMPGDSGGGSGPNPSISAPAFDAAKTYREAIEQLKAGKNAEAKVGLSKLLKELPRDGNIHFLAGMADSGLNDLTRYVDQTIPLTVAAPG